MRTFQLRPFLSPDAGAAGEGTAETVPRQRFNELVTERDALKGQLTDQTRQLKSYEERAATADTLAKQLETEKAAHAATRKGFEMDLALSDAGIADQDGREVAKMLYSRLAEKDRPAISDWLGGFKAKPDSAPKALAVYLPTPVAAADPAKGAGKTKQPPPRAAGGSPDGTQPGAPPEVTPEKIREATQRYQKTRSEADKKALEELIAASKLQRGR